jgi:isoquinoline 1-oxidoreductase beta subunit
VTGVGKLSRRTFLAGVGAAGAAAAVGGLVLGVWRRRARRWGRPVARAQPFAPSVYLAVARDGTVAIWLVRCELGQGVHTALPTLVAEELDADWSRVRVEAAVVDGSYDYGPLRTTGSNSVRGLWLELRQAGAAARAMLVAAAAARWGCAATECRTEAGFVVRGGDRLGYGDLADDAARLPVPHAPRLKEPAEFRLIGQRLPRLDSAAKITGRATFGLDVRVPGMLRAAVARAPTLGGRPRGFDAARARAVPGVRAVVAIASGIAVVAADSWAALAGRRALEVTWEPGPHAGLASADLDAALRRALDAPGAPEPGRDARRIEAVYTAPFLAHATMEPPNATALIADGRCEVWAPTQDPDDARAAAARTAGVPEAHVTVHPTFAGGGFGRRVASDEVVEAVELAGAVGAPVQVVWTREDDLGHDHYREASAHRLIADLDAGGAPIAWWHRQVTPQDVAAGPAALPYALPDAVVEHKSVELPVPVGIWRSVGFSYSVFAVESFMDEVCAATGRDPVALRRTLLAGQPRLAACLDRAAAAAGWGRALPTGRGLGVAVASCFGSHVAQVAEVDADLRVHRVWCAVDCGLAVNPGLVEAQLQGGVAFGLSAALRGRVTFADGGVVETNFHDYPLVRIDEMPPVAVLIAPSLEPPGGVGELGVPTIAPAVANAYAAVTGQRLRALPLLA